MKVSKGGQPIIQPARLSSYHLVPSRPVRERANEELRVTCEKEKKKRKKDGEGGAWWVWQSCVITLFYLLFPTQVHPGRKSPCFMNLFVTEAPILSAIVFFLFSNKSLRKVDVIKSLRKVDVISPHDVPGVEAFCSTYSKDIYRYRDKNIRDIFFLLASELLWDWFLWLWFIWFTPPHNLNLQDLPKKSNTANGEIYFYGAS